MMDDDVNCPYCHNTFENVDDFLFGEIHTCESCSMAFAADLTELGLISIKTEEKASV